MGVTRQEIRLRDGERCARCGQGGVLHVHHRIRRSQGGRDTAENLVTMCEICHRWAHSNPMAARRAGWLLNRHSDPAAVPIDHILWPTTPVLLQADLTFSLWTAA